MKKRFFFAVIAMCAVSVGFAQVTKQVVNVGAFNHSSDISGDEAFIVRNNVIQSLQSTKRIVVVDLLQQADVQMEAERRKSEAALNDEHDVKDITQLNANYILKGTLNSITTERKQGTTLKGEAYTYWSSSLNYTIQLVNPATGATESSYTYTSSSTSRDGASNSRSEAVTGSAKNMKKFIEEAFPVRGTIVAVAEGDAKKAKAVYINLGNDQGLQKGQKFVVYAVIDIAGEKSEKEIGTLTIDEVMSGTRSLCKVNDGGDVIAQNMAKNVEMTVKSRAKKGLFGD